MESIIDIFLRSLPSQLSSQIKEQYKSSVSVLKSYANGNNDKYYSEISNNYEISCFILGLAIFYKSVVIPLREANSSFRSFQSQENINKIQIGKYIFSDTDRNQIQNMCNDLGKILQKYEIPEFILLFSDVQGFARNLNVYLSSRHA